MEREHRNLDRKADEECQKNPILIGERQVRCDGLKRQNVESRAGSKPAGYFRMLRGEVRIDEIQGKDAQQQKNRSEQCVQEKLDGGVKFPGTTPDADDEIHWYEHHFPEHIKQEEVERDEDAQHSGLQHQHEDVILFNAIMNRFPRRQHG